MMITPLACSRSINLKGLLLFAVWITFFFKFAVQCLCYCVNIIVTNGCNVIGITLIYDKIPSNQVSVKYSL
jgi:hypothetical protein